MKKNFLVVALLWAIGFLGLAQAEADLQNWAQAHWEALLQADLDGIMKVMDPEVLVTFSGTPWAGFFRKEELVQLWSAFFQAYKLEEVLAIKVFPESQLVIGEAVLSPGPDPFRIFLKFREGKVVAADYLLISGGEGIPVVDGEIEDGEYAHAMEIAGAKVFWRNGAVVLFVGVTTPGTGWAAVGLDPTGQMHVGANIIIAALTNEGLIIEDQYGFCCPPFHLPDERRDLLEAAGKLTPSGFVLEFAIPLDSGDEQDRPLLPGQTYLGLLAYRRNSPDFRTKHTARGEFTLDLDGPPQSR